MKCGWNVDKIQLWIGWDVSETVLWCAWDETNLLLIWNRLIYMVVSMCVIMGTSALVLSSVFILFFDFTVVFRQNHYAGFCMGTWYSSLLTIQECMLEPAPFPIYPWVPMVYKNAFIFLLLKMNNLKKCVCLNAFTI